MKWKATSHAEAANVMIKLARYGVRVLNDLDIHIEQHSASNDNEFSARLCSSGKAAGTGMCVATAATSNVEPAARVADFCGSDMHVDRLTPCAQYGQDDRQLPD